MAQTLDSAEKEKETFQFLGHCGFLDRVVPGVTPGAKGERRVKIFVYLIIGHCHFQGI